MDGIEYFGVQTLVLLQRLERVVKAGVQFGTRVPGHWDAHELDVRRLRFFPGFEVGVEHETSAASVPKDFYDLDFVCADRGGLRRRHHPIIASCLPFACRQVLLSDYRRRNDCGDGQEQ